MVTEHARGECAVCGKRQRVTQTGVLYRHPTGDASCIGSATEPVAGTVVEPLPPPTLPWWRRNWEDIAWAILLVLAFIVGLLISEFII